MILPPTLQEFSVQISKDCYAFMLESLQVAVVLYHPLG